MQALRKWFPALLLAVLFFTLTPAAHAQGTTPDCRLDFTLTSATNSSTFDNRGKLCGTWVLTYTSTGFSGLTLTVQAAPATAAGIAGSWGTATGTFTGTHPATTTTHALVRLEGFHPFMRLNLSGLTGSGTVTGRLYGYRYVASKVVESGGSGGGLTEVAVADIAAGESQGNGAKFQRSTGTTTTNNCVKFDANGNTVDAGAACSSASPSVASPSFTPNGTNYMYLPTVTLPSATTFSWVNQGSASLTTTNGFPTIFAPANGVPHVKIRTVSLPATPYTVIARLDGTIITGNYPRIGIGLRESGTGKLKTISMVSANSVAVELWASPTTYTTSTTSFAITRAGSLYFKVYNDGTNIVWSVSTDGVGYIDASTAVKANGFTTAADEAFWFVDSNNATYGASVTLISWSIA
jgi:hypothetical protein